MLRISLLFLLSGIACLFLSDLEIISLDPRSEFIRMRDGLLSPAFNVILEFYPAIINTLSIALLSTGLSLLTGLLLAFYFNSRWVRVFSSFIRSIHETEALKTEFLTLFQIGDNNTLKEMQVSSLITLNTHFGVEIGSDRVAFINRGDRMVRKLSYTLKNNTQKLHGF